MPARFLYLENQGSPTRWDVARYLGYLDRIRSQLSPELQSLTAAQRFELPSSSDMSLWLSQVTRISADRDSIAIAAMNDYKTRRFDFNYHGVRKVHAPGIELSFLPAIVVQELVLLPNGLFRHTISDLGGRLVTIYASSIAFQDNRIQ